MGKSLPKRTKDESRPTRGTQENKNERYWKALRVGAVISIIEALSLVLWIKSEDFEAAPAHFLRNLATCGFLAGAAYLAHKLTGKKFKKLIIGSVWATWAALCVIIFMTKSEGPKPHVTIAMQIGDSPLCRIVLTNRYLHRASMVNIITNLPSGFAVFNGLPMGFVIIPMHTGESNAVFHFIVKNDSPLPIHALELLVGFPSEWRLGLDSKKWHEGSVGLGTGAYELALTNFQGKIAECPYVLYPGDWADFPAITNFSTTLWHGPETKIESFRLRVTSPDFEQTIAANLIFFLSPSNFFRPFLIPMVPETNGTLRSLLSTNELLKEINRPAN